jgi:hypothetical protein
MKQEFLKCILELAQDAAAATSSEVALECAEAAYLFASVAYVFDEHPEDKCPVHPCCGQPEACTMRGGVDEN